MGDSRKKKYKNRGFTYVRKVFIEYLICKYAYMEIFLPHSLPSSLPLPTQNCSLWLLNTVRDLSIHAYPIYCCLFCVIVSYNDVIIPMNLGSLTDRLDILFTNKLSMHLPQWNIDSWLGNVWSQHDRSEFIPYLHTPYENWKGEKIKKIEEERLVPHR